MTDNTRPRAFHWAKLFLPIMLLAATQFAVAQNSQPPRLQSDELKSTYVRPGLDLRGYTQFILKPLNLDSTQLIPPPWVEDSDPRRWQLGEQNRKFLQGAFKQAMVAGMEESGEFHVVEKAYRGAVELEVRVLSLEPYAHSDESVTTKGFGALSFEASMRDPRSGELLAVFEGVQQVGQDYQENTQFNRGHNFADQFREWGRNISARMTAIHQIP